MNQLKGAVLAAALAFGCAGSAVAQEAGFYAGVGLGQSTIENDDDFIDFDEDDTGFKVFGGYQLNQYFAAELAYIDNGSPDTSAAGINFEAEATQVNVSAVGMYPFNELFGVMGRLGFSYVDAETKASAFGVTLAEADDSTTDLAYGVGFWFAPTKNFLFRLEYEMTSAGLDDLSDEDTDLTLISVSAAYRFGR